MGKLFLIVSNRNRRKNKYRIARDSAAKKTLLQRTVALAALLTLTQVPSAFARVYDTYRADYMKGAFCSAIGGACASDDDPEGSFFQNPAALTVEPNGLVFDGDYNATEKGELGTNAADKVSESTYMGGVAWSGETWGYGLAFQGTSSSVTSSATLYDDNNQPQSIRVTNTATVDEFYLPFSRRIGEKLSIGIALQAVYATNDIAIDGNGAARGTHLGSDLPSVGLSIGWVYRPSRTFRWGTWAKSPKAYYNRININTTNFGNQIQYQEDFAFQSPWVAATGVSILPFSDDTTLLVDLDVIGATQNGYLPSYDSFSSSINDSTLLRKGRTIALEPRAGFRGPFAGNHLTYMVGTYLEAARTDSVIPRVHATGGLSWKILSWLEPMVGFDVANNFSQAFISFR